MGTLLNYIRDETSLTRVVSGIMVALASVALILMVAVLYKEGLHLTWFSLQHIGATCGLSMLVIMFALICIFPSRFKC